MKKSILIGYIFVSIICGITAGILVHIYNDSKLEQATLKEVENANRLIKTEENIIQTGATNIKTTPNTKIVYETLYLECSDIENTTENIKEEDVNKDEEFFKNKYYEWDIKNFSDEKVELYKEVDEMCKKHFVVREKDGYIAIYNINSNGEESLKETTDIFVQYLPEEDVELLKKGIKVLGDNELAKVIADFE